MLSAAPTKGQVKAAESVDSMRIFSATFSKAVIFRDRRHTLAHA